MLAEFVGNLYVMGLANPFGKIKVNKSLIQYNGKIIECKFDSGNWVFMRERKDKSFPNAYQTAFGVCQSITKPVTREFLLDFVKTRAFRQPSSKRPAPGPSHARVPVVAANSNHGVQNGVSTPPAGSDHPHVARAPGPPTGSDHPHVARAPGPPAGSDDPHVARAPGPPTGSNDPHVARAPGPLSGSDHPHVVRAPGPPTGPDRPVVPVSSPQNEAADPPADSDCVYVPSGEPGHPSAVCPADALASPTAKRRAFDCPTAKPNHVDSPVSDEDLMPPPAFLPPSAKT